MVIENSDYIIDSICRQLRSLELNPDVPNILAAMLSYIGVGHSILPLLEEPVCLSSESKDLFFPNSSCFVTSPNPTSSEMRHNCCCSSCCFIVSAFMDMIGCMFTF